MKLSTLLEAFRLRTLPLALASTLMGSFLALSDGLFRTAVLILSALTTVLLQILSNLANDYGDSQHGVDNEHRLGPLRTVQQGSISKKNMQLLIATFALLALISGSFLIFIGLRNALQILVFYLAGSLAIWAAIKYTIGDKPYGYTGLGDVFVFLFFGLTGVLGTYYLHAQQLPAGLLLPAAAMGCLSTGVLNLNNMRDRENDANSGKNTLVVRIGPKRAISYHILLIGLAFLFSSLYGLWYIHSWRAFLFLLTTPLFVAHLRRVVTHNHPGELDKELKKLAIFTFVFSVIFGFGILLT